MTVARFLLLQGRRVFVPDLLANGIEQGLDSLRNPIGPFDPRDFSAAVAHNKRNNSISCGEGTISDAVRRGRLKQRETIVSGNASGRAVSKRRSEFCGGSSSVFKNALAAWVCIRSEIGRASGR